ncbi:signal recognition particle-docking protein FtsY [Candidatus Woesearchaeota archaeon]|nr:signal recognition particle-docking protein FtsY [Candidatus Woesearchaeota archaeon]
MFGFLKDKLKGVITSFSKKAEEPEEKKPAAEKKKPQKKKQPDEKAEQPEKKGILESLKEQITTTRISKEKFDELFWELELILLENNVAVEVIEKIKGDLQKSLVDKPLPRNQVTKTIQETLGKSLSELFNTGERDIITEAKGKKPYIILFLGINGSGKTTTIAKIASLLQKQKMKVVLAAADTFRAASIEQLQQHADKLGVKMIKHTYGSDPAAVAFDAIRYAESKGIDAVLIDTAGRMHSNTNLMDEMKKIVRISKPDIKIFIGESITGNDCVEQARHFNEAIGVDGIILSKADVDEKGGAAISISYITKKPIIYLGVGQEYEDLRKFDPEIVIGNLGLKN